jgi:hypothetical protein
MDLAGRVGADDIRQRALQDRGCARDELGDLGGLDDVRESVHGQALLGPGRCATRLSRPPAREPLLQARQIFARLGVGGLLAETDGWLDGRGGPGGMVGRP